MPDQTIEEEFERAVRAREDGRRLFKEPEYDASYEAAVQYGLKFYNDFAGDAAEKRGVSVDVVKQEIMQKLFNLD